MGIQIDFDNIFEWDFVNNRKKLNDIPQQLLKYYIEDLMEEKNISENNLYSRELKMDAALYYTLFTYYTEFLETHNLFKSTSPIKELNEFNSNFIYNIKDSLRVLTINMDVGCYPHAVRILREMYKSIIIAIAVNEDDERGNNILFDSFSKRILSTRKDSFDLKNFCENIIKNCDESVTEGTPTKYKTESFYDDLSWTYPLFLKLDPKHKIVKFENPCQASKKNINIKDLAKVVLDSNFEILDLLTEPFEHYSTVEYFINANSYSYPPFAFDDEIERALRDDEEDLFESIKYCLSYMISLITSFLSKTQLPSYLSALLLNIGHLNMDMFNNLTEEDITNLDKKNKVSRFESKILNSFTNLDSTFVKIVSQDVSVKSDSERKVIDEYFSSYREHFLFNNDVMFYEQTIKMDKLSSKNMAIKYSNIFRSLLNAMRFQKKNDKNSQISELIRVKDTDQDFYEGFGDLYVYECNEDISFSDSEGDIMCISAVQLMVNVCNSILVDDYYGVFEESKQLYESILVHLYIYNVKMMNGDCFRLDSSFIHEFYEKNLEHFVFSFNLAELVTMNGTSKAMDDVFLSSSGMKEAERIGSSKYLFEFGKNHNIAGFDDLAFYLSESGVNVKVEMFEKLYNVYVKNSSMFMKKEVIEDELLSLIVLDLASMMFKSLRYSSLSLLKSDDTLEDIENLGFYMIKKDLREIAKKLN
ncbi:MAG: hypothetical protein M0P10_07110 [Sphaerochaetaceae bacterium]|nr:hypothetical protein [Sphaerochaetaceae bacterium]